MCVATFHAKFTTISSLHLQTVFVCSMYMYVGKVLWNDEILLPRVGMMLVSIIIL